MGWKAVKEHYRIEHIVHVTDQGICIGSPYISDLIVIGLDGVIKKRERSTSNEGLCRYQAEMDSNPDTLRDLVKSPDRFARSIPVFTYDGGTILEKMCEEPDGQTSPMMAA